MWEGHGGDQKVVVVIVVPSRAPWSVWPFNQTSARMYNINLGEGHPPLPQTPSL